MTSKLTEVPYVYTAERAGSERRLVVLDTTVLDLREIGSSEAPAVMTYETASGETRTLRKHEDEFYEQAADLSGSIALPNIRDPESIVCRRHGFLGAADRRGRFMMHDTLMQGLAGVIENSDRESVVATLQAEQYRHLLIDGKPWIRVPQPVLIVTHYDDSDDERKRRLLSRGYHGHRVNAIEIRSLDTSAGSDGVASVYPPHVFNINDVAGANARASLGSGKPGLIQASREVATMRVLAQEFFYDRSAVTRNMNLVEAAETQLSEFEKAGMREAPHDAILRWLELRNAVDTATRGSDGCPVGTFALESRKLESVVTPLCQFLAGEKARGKLDPKTEDDIERMLISWNDEMLTAAHDYASLPMR